jgi:hypothetical protein
MENSSNQRSNLGEPPTGDGQIHRRARLIAFYLPQYHPIPENDAWWGKGFTEWRVVASARPLFPGHRQPILPGELGFYDLRVPEVREAQAELAQQHGIEAFCYWHYWLGNGKRLLERPFTEVLRSGKPHFSFCLGWANHSWKGVFFGAGGRTLIEQLYPGLEDYRAHFELLLQAFSDPRYLTVDGKPLMFIYAPRFLPDPVALTDTWRELAHRAGLKGLFIVGGGGEPHDRLSKLGFDANAYSRQRICESLRPKSKPQVLLSDAYRRLMHRPTICSYAKGMQHFLRPGAVPLADFPSIVPNWDNTPRLGAEGIVMHGSNPELFRQHVKDVLDRIAYKPFEMRIAFIKSWNEWAEGNYIEPDSKFGRQYLEALQSEVVLSDLPKSNAVS